MNQNATSNAELALLAVIILLLLLAWLAFFRWFRRREQARYQKPDHICGGCGDLVRPRITQPGSALITILLLLAAVIPGVFYSLWRQSARKKVCPNCGSQDLVPSSSPRGRELAAKYQPAH